MDDAEIAVAGFSASLPDPTVASTITAKRPLSLAARAAFWSERIDDPVALHQVPLVIRA